MQSSFIPFRERKELLFKAGDPAMGFYWIMQGQVEMLVPEKESVIFGPGDMVGLDFFLEEEPVSFDFQTYSTQVETLFIDRRCYPLMQQEREFRRLIEQKLLRYLKDYRQLLVPQQKLYL